MIDLNIVLTRLYQFSQILLLDFNNHIDNIPESLNVSLKIDAHKRLTDQLKSDEYHLEKPIADYLNSFSRILVQFATLSESINQLLKDIDQGKYLNESLQTILFDQDHEKLRFLCMTIANYGKFIILIRMKLEKQTLQFIINLIKMTDPKFDNNCDGISKILDMKQSTSFKQTMLTFIQSSIDQQALHLIFKRLVQVDLFDFERFHLKSSFYAYKQLPIVFSFSLLTIIPIEDYYFIYQKYFQNCQSIDILDGNILNTSEMWQRLFLDKKQLGYKRFNFDVNQMINSNNFAQSLSQIRYYQVDGVLTEEFIVDNLDLIFEHLSNAQSSLRHCFQHDQNSFKNHLNIYSDVFLFEQNFYDKLVKIVKESNVFWKENQDFVLKYTANLIEYFNDQEKFKNFFSNIYVQLKNLEQNKKLESNRIINRLVAMLNEIKEYRQVSGFLKNLDLVQQICKKLLMMLKLLNISQERLTQFDSICDSSYLIRYLSGELLDSIELSSYSQINLLDCMLQKAKRHQQAQTLELSSIFNCDNLQLYHQNYLKRVKEKINDKINQILLIKNEEAEIITKQLPKYDQNNLNILRTPDYIEKKIQFLNCNSEIVKMKKFVQKQI